MKSLHLRNLLLLCLLSQGVILQAQWQNLGSGIVDSPRTIISISAVSEQIVWATAYHPTQMAAYNYTRTIDGGTNWQAGLISDTIGSFYPGFIHALDGYTAWIIMIEVPDQSRIRLFKTTNGGTIWQEQYGDFNSPGYAFASLHFFNSNEGIGFGSPGTGNSVIDSLCIFHTLDGGNTWIRIPPAQLPDPEPGEGVWVYGNNRYASSGDTLWFCTRARRVFRTTDKGITWQAFSAGIGSTTGSYPGLASIAFKNHMEGIVTTYSPSKAARTSDGGETWTTINIPASPNAGNISFIQGSNASYIIHRGLLTTTQGVFLITNDGGDSWITINLNPATPAISFLSSTVGFGGGKINSAMDGGMYKWIGDWTTGIVSVSDHAVTRIFPNPTNDHINISGLDPAKIHSTEIFSINGALVAKPENITGGIDVSQLKPGIYLLRISHDNGTSNLKFVKQ